ncbi:hypothetical protein SADUNF_Sadunf11G0036400 [Salix dunnii]|uniref:Uncharacterized protein n=1 Tax=Salix dunnii TaxID=1413687 RepID=A0A835JMY9_9ROSI|nr:hypothetical protein SADUNF_Sadunf11G0036400 [Salix dunnii]
MIDCGLERTQLGWSLHCLFLTSKRKLASKFVIQALVLVPRILVRVPQNLPPLSFWDGPSGAAKFILRFFLYDRRCSARSLSVRAVAPHLVDH